MKMYSSIMRGCGVAICLSVASFASEKEPQAVRNEIRFHIKNGGDQREFRYRYTLTQIRIDRPGDLIPSPAVNVLDLEKGTLRILHPHNGSWEQTFLDGSSATAETALDSSAFPSIISPVDGREITGLPNDLPKGIGPGAVVSAIPSDPMGMTGGMPMEMPAFPVMPDFPMDEGGDVDLMKLTSQGQTNMLFGFSCQLYEMTLPDQETLSLWLCDDPGLPAFYLPANGVLRPHELQEWDRKVARILRQEKKFPFHVILKGESGDTRVEWRVLSVKPEMDPAAFNGIFEVPSEMYRL